jgi:hypothetical protein
VSHFNYLRDNVLLTWMRVRFFLGFLFARELAAQNLVVHINPLLIELAETMPR